MTLAGTIAIFIAKYVIFMLVVAAGLWLLFGVPREQKKQVIILGAISLPLIFLVSLVAGKLYVDPRPFVAGHFTPLIPHDTDNGFPSNHTLLAAAIASVVWHFNRKLGAVFFVTALAIGMCRVYAGVHHIIDIEGSIAIAAIVTYAVSLAIKRIPRLADD